MLKHYFSISWRHLLKHPTFSLTAVTTLSIGVSMSLLIAFWLRYEADLDTFHDNYEDIYGIHIDTKIGSNKVTGIVSALPSGPKMVEEFPEVEHYTFTMDDEDRLVRYKDKAFMEDKMMITDTSFFQMFDFDLVSGDKNTCMASPDQVVITKKTAKKYFGDKDPMGEVLEVRGRYSLTVVGVLEDLPPNTQFDFDFIISYLSVHGKEYFDNHWKWDNLSYPVYIRLVNGTDPHRFKEKIQQTYIRNASNFVDFEALELQGGWFHFNLIPFHRIHFFQTFTLPIPLMKSPSIAKGDYVNIFAAIALLVILVSAFNFVNLYIAQNQARIPNFQFEHHLGAQKKDIILRLLVEVMIISILSGIVSLLLVWSILGLFNFLVNGRIPVEYIWQPYNIFLFFAIPVLVGWLASLYPIIKLLRSVYGRAKDTRDVVVQLPRKILIGSQFAVSIFIISLTILFYKQLSHLQESNIGFDRQQILVIKNMSSIGSTENKRVLADEIRALPDIENVSITDYVPFTNVFNNNGARNLEDPEDEIHIISSFRADQYFFDTYDVAIIEGEIPTGKLKPDQCIMNEAAAMELFGPEDNVVGKHLHFNGRNYFVAGIIENVQFEPAFHKVRPLIIEPLPNYAHDFISVKISTEQIDQVIQRVNTYWDEFSEAPFEYYFLDDGFNQAYHTDKQSANLLLIFSGVAIALSCLGLFSLSISIIQKRTKEIAIRKVNGATVIQLLKLLTNEFNLMILLALVIASPAVFYFGNQWLEKFAYKTSLNWWVFIISAIIVSILSVMTVGYHTLKAANTNPVDSLRSE